MGSQAVWSNEDIQMCILGRFWSSGCVALPWSGEFDYADELSLQVVRPPTNEVEDSAFHTNLETLISNGCLERMINGDLRITRTGWDYWLQLTAQYSAVTKGSPAKE